MTEDTGKTRNAPATDTTEPAADQGAPEATTQQPDGPGKTDAAVTMTQAQLDALFEDRAARATEAAQAKLREKYGDFDALAKKAQEFDALKESELTEVQRMQRDLEKAQTAIADHAPKLERLDKLEAYVTTHIEKRTEGLPEPVKALLSKLNDPLDVLAYLDEYADTLTTDSALKPAPSHATEGTRTGERTPVVTLRRPARL